MKQPPGWILLSPGDLSGRAAATFARTVEALLAGTGGGLLLREPELDDRTFCELALDVREALGRDGWLGLHDRAHLFETVRAQALHLGFRSLTPAVASELCPDAAIGLSCHAGEPSERLRGATYRFVSPVRAVPKPYGELPPLGPDGLAREVARSELPAWALGGVEAHDVAMLRGAGARGVAVLRAVWRADDPRAAALELDRACRDAFAQTP